MPPAWEPETRIRSSIFWAQLYGWQADQCAICGKRYQLVIDHCHATGLVRGLLCYQCNSSEVRSDHEVYRLYREKPPAAMMGFSVQYANHYAGRFATCGGCAMGNCRTHPIPPAGGPTP